MKFSKFVVVFISLLVLVPFAAAQYSSPVRIVNTPLPVEGSVFLAGTPTVNVATMPGVSITSLPAVNLRSGATVAIDPATTVNTVDVSARNIVRLVASSHTSPYNVSLDATLVFGSGGTYYVPSGKRLVINSISGRYAVAAGNIGTIEVTTDMGFSVYPESSKVLTSATQDVFIFNSAAPFYVDAGRHVRVGFTGGNSTNLFVDVNLQGYLVDCGDSCTEE